MKSRRNNQKTSKASLQDPKIIDSGHTSASKRLIKHPDGIRSVASKPFRGKVFYLDLPSSKRTETLEHDITKLGGTIEKFFSKEIKYLVSNKKEAKYVKYLSQDSPVPSPDSGHSSPHPAPGPCKHSSPHPAPGPFKHSSPHLAPGPCKHSSPHPAPGPCNRGSYQGPNDTGVQSRGKALVERVVKEQERLQVNRTLCKALEWGVKIIYVDDIIAYVEKKKKNVSTLQTAAVNKETTKPDTARPGLPQNKGRIKKPFLKIEDSSRHYRPIYLSVPAMPELLPALSCCPFLQDHSRTPKERWAKRSGTSTNEQRGRVRPRKNRKRGGYCECCALKYNNIKTHLQGELHRTFAQSDEYLLVDRLTSSLPFSFLHIQPRSTRPKSSISSTLRVPALCVGTAGPTDQASMWPSTAGPKDAAGPQGRSESQGGGGAQARAGPQGRSEPLAKVGPRVHPPKHCSVSSSLGPPAEERRGLNRQPRTRSLPSKRAFQQRTHSAVSSTAGPVKEAILNAHPSSSHPETLTPAGLEGNAACMDKIRLPRCYCGADFKLDVPLGNMVVPSSQLYVLMSRLQEEVLPACEEVLPACEEVLPACEEEHPADLGGAEQEVPQCSSSPSPGRKLHRKVRHFKRKRRKVEVRASSSASSPACSPGSEEPGEESRPTLLNTWQLFQSSEDMDWDFQGFPG